MLFELRFSRDKFSVESGVEKGRPLPQWVEDAPEVVGSDQFYLNAFYELSSCREVGMAMGPIPWRDIIAYAQYSELDQDLTMALIVIIREMDGGFLQWQAKEQDRKAAAEKFDRG